MGSKPYDVVEDQPRLTVQHGVVVASAPARNGHAKEVEQVLDAFYAQHGPGWELVNIFKLGSDDFMTNQRELMFVFQRRSYLGSSG